MVYWYIKESLNLVGVQVHRNNSVYSCHAQQVGYQFGSDAYSWLVFSVLSCPTEIGNDGNDVTGGSSLSCVDHQKQLHQIVRVGEGTLNEEHVASTNGFFVGNGKFSVRESRNHQFTEWTAQTGANLLG